MNFDSRLAGLLVPVFAVSLASADVERSVIFRTGMAAVGFPPGSIINAQNLGAVRPLVNNRGHVVVWGTAVGSGIPSDANDAIWLATRDGLVLLLRENDPFPAPTGDVRFVLWSILGIGDDDSVVVQATLRGDVTGANNSALCRLRPGAPLEVIARTGDTINDIPESPTWTSFARHSGFRFPLNTHGEFVIRAVTSDGNVGWYESRDGGLAPLLAPVQALLNAPAGTVATQASVIGWSDTSIALFYVTLAGGGTTTLNDSAVIAASREGARVILREGDPVPGVPEASVGSTFPPTNLAYAGDAELFAFTSVIGAGSPVVWTGSIDEPGVLVQRGDAIPGSSTTFESIFWLEGGPDGNAFCANRSIGGAGAWVERDGEVVTLCQPGQPAPENEPNVTFGSVSALGNDGPIRLANFNRAAFYASLTGPVPQGANRIVYQTDVSGAPRRVLRLGDVFVWNGDPISVSQINTMNLSSRGYLAVHASLSGTSIILAKVGCPGSGCDAIDFNGDCHISLDDLSILLSHFGADGLDPTGDTDRDHDVDLSDLANLLAGFANDCR